MVSLFLTYTSFNCYLTCCVWSEVDFLFPDDVVATAYDLVQTLTILFSYDTLQGCVESTATCLWKSFFFTIDDLLMEKAFISVKLFFTVMAWSVHISCTIYIQGQFGKAHLRIQRSTLHGMQRYNGILHNWTGLIMGWLNEKQVNPRKQQINKR
jgi:hypothetical protein